MPQKKLQLFDNNKRVVRFDPKATNGAVVGENLWLADGTLVTEAFFGRTPTPGDPNNLYITAWRLVLEIPPHVGALAATTTTGLYAITSDDTSVTRAIEGTTDEIDVEDGNAVAGNPKISLSDLADSGVGAALRKLTRDGKGRISGMEAADTDDLDEGATNLYYTDDRADARAEAAVDDHVADTEAHPADNITVTPVGDIVDTNVQAVLAALDARLTALEP